MSPPKTARQQLASDLAEMLRFSRYRPDVDYMAGLLLQAFAEGRYDVSSVGQLQAAAPPRACTPAPGDRELKADDG